MSRDPKDNIAPELDTDEQRDADQAPNVADDAIVVSTDLAEESEHGASPDRTALMSEYAPDLVDRMNQMVTLGRMDNGAFAGELVHDDEEDGLGETDSEEDDI